MKHYVCKIGKYSKGGNLWHFIYMPMQSQFQMGMMYYAVFPETSTWQQWEAQVLLEEHRKPLPIKS